MGMGRPSLAAKFALLGAAAVVVAALLVACGGEEPPPLAGTPAGGGTGLPPRSADTPVGNRDPTPAPPSPDDTPASSRDPAPAPPSPGDTPVASRDPAPTFTPGPGRRLEPAPIDAAEILVRESFPPRYAVAVTAGLPSGCAQPAGHEVRRDGTTVRVLVWNSMPVGNVACTLIYGTYRLTVEMGADFVSGMVYTVHVNDRTLSFRAQ
jgi:hypothetical protein